MSKIKLDKSNFKSVKDLLEEQYIFDISYEEYLNNLTYSELDFELEREEYERLDIEAKNELINFKVR